MTLKGHPSANLILFVFVFLLLPLFLNSRERNTVRIRMRRCAVTDWSRGVGQRYLGIVTQ